MRRVAWRDREPQAPVLVASIAQLRLDLMKPRRRAG
jgi:hypothetical protein